MAGQPTNRPAHQPKGANPSPIPLTTQARTREAEPSRSLLTSSAARRQERSLPLDSPARARSPWPLPLPLQPPAPPELASSLLSLSPFPPCAPTSSVSRGCVRAGAAPAALVASALLSVGRRRRRPQLRRRPPHPSIPATSKLGRARVPPQPLLRSLALSPEPLHTRRHPGLRPTGRSCASAPPPRLRRAIDDLLRSGFSRLGVLLSRRCSAFSPACCPPGVRTNATRGNP